MSVWKKFQKTYDPNLAVFTMSKKCVTNMTPNMTIRLMKIPPELN